MKSGVTNRGMPYGSRLPPGTAWVKARWIKPNFDARYSPDPPIVPAFKKSRRVAITCSTPPGARLFELSCVVRAREKITGEDGKRGCENPCISAEKSARSAADRTDY